MRKKYHEKFDVENTGYRLPTGEKLISKIISLYFLAGEIVMLIGSASQIIGKVQPPEVLYTADFWNLALMLALNVLAGVILAI